MLESSNLNSIIAANEALAIEAANTTSAISSTEVSQQLHAVKDEGVEEIAAKSNHDQTAIKSASNSGSVMSLAPSVASVQLAAGILQIFEPPLLRAKSQLKELIGKQNKIYIDLSAEKYKLDNVEVSNLQHMKRALYIQACKQKELQRMIQKQQQEESLIAKQQQQQQQQEP